jgi:hypothetical protein
MHKHRYRLAAAAALLLAGMSAQACEIRRDKELGVWRGTCVLRDFLVSEAFIARYQRPFIFKLPDLQIREFDYFVSGSVVEVYAEVENIGGADAPASVVTVDVSIGNPLTGNQQGASQQFTAQVPPLARNSSRSVLVGSVTVSSTTQDWDLIVFGVTDPPTMAQPMRGAVIESNESNNMLNHSCRWYGPNPDLSLPGCN